MKKFCKKNTTIIITYLIAVLLLVFVSIMKPGYASVNNLKILGATAGVLGLTALGQTCVILTGGMDLSIPWMLTISSFALAEIGGTHNIAVTIVCVLIMGTFLGTLNGLGVAYVGIAPVIMTMASNTIFKGALVGVMEGSPSGGAPDVIQKFSTSSTAGISNIFLFWLAVSAVAIIVLIKSPFGRKLYAVGSNETVALFSGINVKHIKVAAYAISGFSAALAGIVYAGRLGQLYLGMGDNYQMESISAVAVGGIALTGGSGSYVGTIAGVLILTILTGVLSALNIEQSVQKIIYGIVLFIAVLLSSRTQNKGN